MEVDEKLDQPSLSSETQEETKDGPSSEQEEQPNLEELLRLFRRFQLYGTELSVVTGSNGKSISSWLSVEGSNKYRLWSSSVSLKSVQQLDKAIAKCATNQTDRKQLEDAVKKGVLENVSSAACFTNSFLVAQLFRYPNTRTIGAELLPSLIATSEDMLLFNKFYAKKGNPRKYQAVIYKWYCDKVNNDEGVMDLLLTKSVMGWSHKDVFKLWHLPIDKNILHRLICGITSVDLELLGVERQKFLENCLKIRKMNTAKAFLEFFAHQENVDRFRSVVLLALKSQACTEVTTLEAIKLMDVSSLIEMIPRIFNRFPNNTQLVQEIVHRLCKQCKEPDESVSLNPLPLFLIPRWLDFKVTNRLIGRKQKEPSQLIKDRLNRLFIDTKVEQIDNLLFILELDVPEEEVSAAPAAEPPDGSKLNLRRNQDVKRPAVVDTVVKPLEFVALLLEKYHTHKIFHNGKLIHLKGNISDIHSSLSKLEPSTPSMWPLNYNNVIMITLNKPFTRYSEAWLQKFDKLRILRISLLRQNSSSLSSKCNSYFTINGFDKNTLHLIHKYFTP